MAYIAPHNPVADWRAVPQGHGYGNYYDPVTDTWASVTRTTPKTARVAADRLVDVPAGYLALEPWSLHNEGGVGLTPIIEEARTNYLLNSCFAADTNADGLADDWSVGETVSGTPTVSRTSGIYGPFAQNVYYESASDSGKIVGLQAAMTAVGSFAAGDAATLSFYARSDGSEAGFTAYLLARDAAGAALGVVSLSLSLTSEWSRYSLTYATLPAGTSRCIVQLFATGVDTGDIVDFTIDACQLEKGAFATSYIHTTAAVVTRNADVVTGLDASAGTQVIVRSAANLAPPAAVDTFTGDPAAAMANRAVHRVCLYDTALTGEQLAAADMTTDLLAGLDTARVTNEVTL